MGSLNDFLELTLDERATLQSLDLTDSNLDHLEPTCFETFCRKLTQCPLLQFINLHCTNLGQLKSTQLQTLCETLPQCYALQSLSLGANNFEDLDITDFKAFCTALTQCRLLKSINLNYGNLTHLETEHFLALCNTFPQCHALQSLELFENALFNLDTPLLQAFYQSITQCRTLQSINLGANELARLNSDGWVILAHTLKNMRLHRLYLHSNDLNTVDPYRLELLGQALSQCPTLQVFKFIDNDSNFDINLLSGSSVQTFFNALAKSQSITQMKCGPNALLIHRKPLSGICARNHDNLVNSLICTVGTWKQELPEGIKLKILKFAFPKALVTKVTASIAKKSYKPPKPKSHRKRKALLFTHNSQFETITSLDFSNRNFGTVSQSSFCDICKQITQCYTLRSIDLRNTNLSALNGDDFEELLIALGKTRVTQIYMDDTLVPIYRDALLEFCQTPCKRSGIIQATGHTH